MPEKKPLPKRKGCQIPLLLFLLLAALVSFPLFQAFTAKPGSMANYIQQLQALTDQTQPNPNPATRVDGWHHFKNAGSLQEYYTFEQANSDGAEWYNALEFVAEHQVSGDVRSPLSSAEYYSIAKQAIQAHEERGTFSELDLLANADFFSRPLPESENPFEISLPEIGEAHILSRLTRARMHLAHQRGDDATAIAAFTESLAVARCITHQGFAIHRTVGTDIAAESLEELRCELVERPYAPADLQRAADELSRFKIPSIELPLKTEHIIASKIIRMLHTESGRAIPTEINKFKNMFGTLSSDGTVTSSSLDDDNKLLNLAWITLPRRQAYLDFLDQYHAVVLDYAALDRKARATTDLDPNEFVNQNANQLPLITTIVGSINRLLSSEDTFTSIHNGTRIMLALEQFNAQNGTYPKTLNELTPDILPSLPTDPFAKNSRFIYRTLDPALDDPPDLWNRPYTLYSVGFDETDDGGLTDTEANSNAFRYGKSGTDFIFNLPRPSPTDDDK